MRLPRASWLGINPASLTLVVTVLAVMLYVWGAPILDLIELKTYDLRFLSRGRRQPTPAVVIAAIDEKSLEAEGRWPWPRSKFAALIDILSREGARVIGFDIAFSEPDENSQLALIDQFAQTVDALDIRDRRLSRFLRDRRVYADNDLALATAIKRSGAAVVLGYFFHMSEATLEYRLEPNEIERRANRLAGSKYPSIVRHGPEPSSVPFITAYAPQNNLDIFSEAAASSGYFSLRSDPDGVLRWMPLVIQLGDDLFPPLSVACAWHYLGRPRLTVMVGRQGVEGVQLGDRFIATDEVGQLLINYPGPPKTFTQVSVTDILKGQVRAGIFKDRIVLVGATALGTYDLRNTPFSPLYPGTEVHASVIDNILTRSYMARPEWSKLFDLSAIVVLAALVGVALPRLGPLNGLGFAVGLFIVYVLLARWLFVAAHLWLNVVYPLLALVAVYTTLTAYHYLTEQRQRKKVKDTFRHYVAPLVVEEMLKDPRRLKLGGEVKTLTVLFSDLEGFTSYSERYAPDEMAEMLGEYYNRMTEQIFVHRGTLKEYVGDELMAIFGAPLEQADHAERACAAALAMREARLELAVEWAKIGRPKLRARTGINSGPMLVGNLGSKYRFAYGALGDQVNLGSRLEGLNKVYGTDILVGENTARLVERAFLLREVDTVRVLGRAQPVRIYELVARLGTARVFEQEKALKAYAAGLEAYRQKVWDEALSLFEQALTIWPAEGPARTLAERCAAYRNSPPPADWDGVFEQAFKK
jgi:adenylate cyclase